MRRSTIFLAILIAVLAIPVMPSAAQEQSATTETQQVQITIVNNTGFPIWYVYISPSRSDEWGPDLLDDDQIINDGESVTLNLPNLGAGLYDIMLEGSVGETYSKSFMRINADDKFVFTFDDIEWLRGLW